MILQERQVMVLTADKIKELIQQGESESVEFKAVIRDASTIAQNISAFANAHGGTLLIGVREPSMVVGVNPDEVISLVEKSKSMLTPLQYVDVSTSVINGKTVVAVTIPQSKEVVFYNGMAMKRVGDQVRALSPSDISAKITTPANAAQISYLAEAIVKQTEIINGLRADLKKAGSPLSKLTDYVIGGIIGAILGVIATALIQ